MLGRKALWHLIIPVPSANPEEPAAKRRREEDGVIRPFPASVAWRPEASCNICGSGGRLETCHLCHELGCRKCNFWCSEKTGGCGLIVCATCNSFDNAVTEGQKCAWH